MVGLTVERHKGKVQIQHDFVAALDGQLPRYPIHTD